MTLRRCGGEEYKSIVDSIYLKKKIKIKTYVLLIMHAKRYDMIQQSKESDPECIKPLKENYR